MIETEEGRDKLKSIAGILNNLDFIHERDIIDNSLKQLAQDTIFVAVCGETSSGKSTWLNGMMNGPYLYTTPLPSTSSITFIEYGDKESYLLEWKNGNQEIVSRSEYEKLVKEKESIGRIRSFTIKVPSDKLKGKFTFIDTPGFNSLVKEHTDILKHFIPSSDIVLYFVNAQRGIRLEDKEMLVLLKNLGKRIIVCQNFDPELKRTDIRKFLGEILSESVPEVFPLSVSGYYKKGYPILESSSIEDRLKDLSDHNGETLQNILGEKVLAVLYGVKATMELKRDILLDDNNKHEISSIKISIEEEKNKLNSRKSKISETFSKIKIDLKEKIDKWSDDIYNNAKQQIKLFKGPKEFIDYLNNSLICRERELFERNTNAMIETKLASLTEELEKEDSIFLHNIYQSIDKCSNRSKLFDYLSFIVGGASAGSSLYMWAKAVGGAAGWKNGVYNITKQTLGWVNKGLEFVGQNKIAKPVFDKIAPLFKNLKIAPFIAIVIISIEAAKLLKSVYVSCTWENDVLKIFKKMLPDLKESVYLFFIGKLEMAELALIEETGARTLSTLKYLNSIIDGILSPVNADKEVIEVNIKAITKSIDDVKRVFLIGEVH